MSESINKSAQVLVPVAGITFTVTKLSSLTHAAALRDLPVWHVKSQKKQFSPGLQSFAWSWIMQDPKTYRSDFVTKLTLVAPPDQARIDFPPTATEVPGPDFPRSAALTLDWLFDTSKGRSLSDRILARLVQFEAHETDVWLRENIRQAFITVSLAAKGSPIPHIEASQTMCGKHHDKVWPAIMHNRRMRLAKEFPDWYDDAGNQKPDIPKKPAVRNQRAEQAVNERLAALVPSPERKKA